MARTATVALPAPPAALSADLVQALRRLKLGTVRRLAPEVLHTAKVQRWTPEEVLRTLIEAECAARDESNLRTRLRGAGFPVTKSLQEFKVAASSVPQATFDYLAGLEWIPKADNLCLVGPAGTGKSHYADLRIMPIRLLNSLQGRVTGLARSA
jgi:DNA replication protein DnaC